MSQLFVIELSTCVSYSESVELSGSHAALPEKPREKPMGFQAATPGGKEMPCDDDPWWVVGGVNLSISWHISCCSIIFVDFVHVML